MLKLSSANASDSDQFKILLFDKEQNSLQATNTKGPQRTVLLHWLELQELACPKVTFFKGKEFLKELDKD